MEFCWPTRHTDYQQERKLRNCQIDKERRWFEAVSVSLCVCEAVKVDRSWPAHI
jgi:hypothetical protein